MKQEFIRGSRKRFQTTITALSGAPEDPDTDTCFVRLEKGGTYNPDSTPWHLCSPVGTTGEFGADIWLQNSLTLGDWVARFKWEIDGDEDMDSFEFVLKRKDQPWVNKGGPKL